MNKEFTACLQQLGDRFTLNVYLPDGTDITALAKALKKGFDIAFRVKGQSRAHEQAAIIEPSLSCKTTIRH